MGKHFALQGCGCCSYGDIRQPLVSNLTEIELSEALSDLGNSAPKPVTQAIQIGDLLALLLESGQFTFQRGSQKRRLLSPQFAYLPPVRTRSSAPE